MGLIAKFTGVDAVFEFFSDCFGCLPFAIKSLVYIAFCGMVFIAVLRSIWR